MHPEQRGSTDRVTLFSSPHCLSNQPLLRLLGAAQRLRPSDGSSTHKTQNQANEPDSALRVKCTVIKHYLKHA